MKKNKLLPKCLNKPYLNFQVDISKNERAGALDMTVQ